MQSVAIQAGAIMHNHKKAWLNFYAISIFFADVFSLLVASGTVLGYEILDHSEETIVQVFDVNFRYTALVLLISFVWILYFIAVGAYKPYMQFDANLKDGHLFNRACYFLFGLGFAFFLSHTAFSRIAYGLYALISVTFMFTLRHVVRFVLSHLLHHKKRTGRGIYLIGTDEAFLKEFAHKVDTEFNLGYHVVATHVLHDSVNELDSFISKAVMKNEYADFLVIAPNEGRLPPHVIVNHLSSFHVSILVYPTLALQESYVNFLVRDSSSPFFRFRASRIDRLDRIIKRSFDIVFSVLVLVIGFPIWALLVLAMLITQGTPILYISERVGMDKKIFKFLKFRTMVRDADQIKDLVPNGHGDGHVLFKNPNDPRITKMGKFLRRSSFDELPQFINVLRGEMSVVGPRPALPEEAIQYSPIASRRLGVKPGMTGPWQVSGRADLSWDKSVTFDLNYAMNWSFSGDLWLIFRTIGVMITGKGAY